jgi:hypothetical protein
VQRDVGGYAVALAASMKYNFCGNAGETFFATSDIGWVVGHSYIVYGPLIAGMATIMYEGCRSAPIPASGGASSRSTRSRACSPRRPPSACCASSAGIHAQARQVFAEGAVSGRRAAR